MSDLNVFTEQTPPQSAFDALVGEGKKYATVEDMAKSVDFAQRHIEALEAETAQYRQALAADVEAQRQQTPIAPPPASPEQRIDEVDLETRIRQTLEKANTEQKLSKNVNEVSQKLVEVFGDAAKANAAVQQKATELGVSLSFLMDSAAQSPKAFYAQMGLNTAAAPKPGTPGTVNSAALAAINPQRATQPGTYAYYEDLRKTNPKLYNSPRIQLQMHKEAGNPGFFD